MLGRVEGSGERQFLLRYQPEGQEWDDAERISRYDECLEQIAALGKYHHPISRQLRAEMFATRQALMAGWTSGDTATDAMLTVGTLRHFYSGAVLLLKERFKNVQAGLAACTKPELIAGFDPVGAALRIGVIHPGSTIQAVPSVVERRAALVVDTGLLHARACIPGPVCSVVNDGSFPLFGVFPGRTFHERSDTFLLDVEPVNKIARSEVYVGNTAVMALIAESESWYGPNLRGPFNCLVGHLGIEPSSS